MKFFTTLTCCLFAIASADRWDTTPDQSDVDSGSGMHTDPMDPTQLPSSLPVDPTIVPTNAPVPVPAVVPPPPQVDAPTDTPVVPPTDTPVVPPTDSPTNPPTEPPTSPPDRSSDATGCVLVQNNFYGSVDGESQFINFVYEVETVQVPTDTMENIIMALEAAIAEKALPTLFGDACPSARRLKGRRLAAIGVSTFPVDRVIDRKSNSKKFMIRLCCQTNHLFSTVPCQVALADDGNLCSVFDGIFTIFTDGTDVDNDAVLSVITTAASNGEFDDAHVDVLKVVIITVNPDGVADNTVEESGNQVGDSPQLGLGMYIGVAAGSLLIIGAAFFYRRSRKYSNVDTDSTIMTPRGEAVTGETPQPVYDLSPIS